MFDGADTVVLYEELAFQDVLPLRWRAAAGSLDRELAAGFEDRNVRILQAWEAMDEHAPAAESADDSGRAADIMRLDLKVNLLLELVGQLLVAGHPRPEPVAVRFNALGAGWRAAAPLPDAGTEGILEIYLRDCLAEPLRLPGRIASVAPDGHVRVKFLPLSEAVADSIEKVAFRRHRRQIAGARQPRR